MRNAAISVGHVAAECFPVVVKFVSQVSRAEQASARVVMEATVGLFIFAIQLGDAFNRAYVTDSILAKCCTVIGTTSLRCSFQLTGGSVRKYNKRN